MNYPELHMEFPSMKAKDFLALLMRKQLGYQVIRQSGTSHRIMESTNGFPRLVVSFHDRQTIPPGLVRKILMKDIGLTEKQCKDLL